MLASDPAAPHASDVGGSVYFDFWGRFMVRLGCRQLFFHLLSHAPRAICSHAQAREPRHRASPVWRPTMWLLPNAALPQVIYSHAQAKALHHAPLFIVLLLPLLGERELGVVRGWLPVPQRLCVKPRSSSCCCCRCLVSGAARLQSYTADHVRGLGAGCRKF